MTQILKSAVFCMVLLLILPREAEASLLYMDPMTGSIILQVLAGGVLAGGAAIKMYWNRIRSIFVGGRQAEVAPKTRTHR